jgi:eukaryotic-like serine/threonine-protein kinase
MPVSPSPADIPFQENGRYKIEDRPIGQGGMGIVYKAYDTVTKRYVALKTMWGNVDPAALDLFEREWTVLARLSHPNIVDILDTGQFEKGGLRKPYFVMPLLPGVTLEYLIKSSSQRLTVERTVGIIGQTCRGLQAAHDQGLVHRDIKPSNIFVMDDDTVKIIDFGVVHLADAHSMTGLKGTLQYMAPEQLENKPATALSDIFALGVVCYEALTGRKPFLRKTEAETFEAIRTYVPPPASEINGSINQLLSRTVHKAIAKQPWHRFSTARELAETLQRAFRNEPIERFDRSKIQARIERVKKARNEGDYQFANEILSELESEGHIDPEMSVLRIQVDQAIRQKTIRQLLESARIRMEEDEYPLALQKIQDVLNIDPTNLDASALKAQIERHRSEKQIENWFRLVAQHLDNEDYAQARQGLQQILKINSANTKARELLAQVDRTEQEVTKAREEKQKLYETALTAYRNGEISTALSNLERLLEVNRARPKSATPDRDAQYQSLYNQIRSERDAARNAYAEGRKHLADRNFAKVLEICQKYLQKHPGDPLFQALKIESEEMQRQEQSAAVAETNRRVENEPDLDKKYSIVKEAVSRYPHEPQFKSSLKLLKERRDLINSIVGRARTYEERGQLNDAAGQWDILRNIYPQYPGLDFEIQRLARRCEEQVRYETKARWVEEIDRHLGVGAYARAWETVNQALLEFPDDHELQGLRSLAEQGMQRSDEAQKLLQRGEALLAEEKYDEGLAALREAVRLDERNPANRSVLANALLGRARDLIAQDWRAASPLVSEALELDNGDPVARGLSSQIDDYKRQEAVSKIVLESRALQAAGDLSAALKKVEEGLSIHPSEVRLSQLHNTLRSASADSRRKEPVAGQAAQKAAAGVSSEIGKSAVSEPRPIETIIQPVTPPPQVPAAPRVQEPPRPRSPVRAEAPKAPPKFSRKTNGPIWITSAAVAVVVIAMAVWVSRKPRQPVPAVTKAVPRVTPKAAPSPVSPPAPVQPNLPELRITSDLRQGSGQFALDGEPPVDLQQGGFTKGGISTGDHTARILDGKREVFSFDFHVQPKEFVTLSAPPKGAIPGIVIVSLGDRAKVYASPNTKGGLEGQPVLPIPAEGLPVALPSLGNRMFIVDDGKSKPRSVPLELSSLPAVNVVLSTREQIPLTVTSNVPDAIVVVNGRPLQRSMANGKRIVPLAPGKYAIAVTADDYEAAPEQAIEIKSGDQNLQPLSFSLTRIAHSAALSIESAPVGAEVLVDGNTVGTVSSGGTFTRELSPGKHTISLQKPNYVDYSETRELKAGQTAKINPEEMKAYGAVAVKITPPNARITYRRANESKEANWLNNGEHSVPPGEYVVVAEADGFAPRESTVSVAPGKTTSLAWELKETAKPALAVRSPATVFENGAAWHKDDSGWWVHDAKGYSFLKVTEGTFGFQILRDAPKNFFKSKVKKVTFVVEDKGNADRVVYTLDARRLTEKIYSGGNVEEKKFDLGPGQTLGLIVEMTSDAVIIKTGAGLTLDSFKRTIKRSGTPGRFGFQDEVALSMR